MKGEKKRKGMDFPSGIVDKSLPDNSGDKGSVPGLERLHSPVQLSLCATLQSLCSRAHMLQLLNPVPLEPVLHKRSHCDEKSSYCN